MEKINKEKYLLFRDITFKTTFYHRNYDLIVPSENIISEHEGRISKLRILENKFPLQIGEFSLSVWNLKLGRDLNYNLYDLLKIHTNELIYDNTLNLLDKNLISFDDYDKIVFIHSLVIMKEFRKKEITEEFIEFIYKNFYNDKTLILALVFPIQYNNTIMDYYVNTGFVDLPPQNSDLSEKKIPKNKYYKLNEIISENSDQELNEIKLFSIGQKCGFERIDESYIFKFNPTKTIERLKLKLNVLEKI
jgi:hypothetical protein